MKKVIQVIKEIEFRPRLSLILAISQHVNTILKNNKNIDLDLEKAFKSAWKWLENQENTAFDIYDLTQPLFEHAAVFKNSEKILSTIYSAISALYYAVWEIDAYEFTYLGRDNSAKFKSDFFEISDSFIEDTIKYALQASDNPDAESAWQQNRILYFYEKYKSQKSDSLGEYVSQEQSLGVA
jgi:Immunity protein Imm6